MDKMSRIQGKITCHSKNEDDHSMNEKRQPKDANTEVIYMLELSDKNFEVAIIKMLQQVIR